jgi:hypothetical protein
MESNFDGYDGLCEIFELSCTNMYLGDNYSKLCFTTRIWSQLLYSIYLRVQNG